MVAGGTRVTFGSCGPDRDPAELESVRRVQLNGGVPDETNAKPPWKRRNPRKTSGTSKKLSPTQKGEARARARAAGRPYPNLVDNMAVARTRKVTTKRAAKKR